MSTGTRNIIRPFDPSNDLPRLLALRQQTEAIDRDGITTSLETLRAQMEIPGHNPEEDRWVVFPSEKSTEMIGFAAVWTRRDEQGDCRAEFHLVVHPRWRGQGLGGQLLERAIARARALGASHAALYPGMENRAAHLFLEHNGFARIGEYREMRAPGLTPTREAIFPEGFTLKPFADVLDVATLTHAMNHCYAGQWGHNDVSQEQMAEWLKDFDPNGLFLLFSPEGWTAGISRVEINLERTEKNHATTGYIDSPGIAPEFREQELYRPMLLAVMRWLQEMGAVFIELESWGDEAEKVAICRRNGFTNLSGIVAYEYKL